MNILRSTTVSTRLTISFLFPLLMLFAVAALGAWKLQQARESSDQMVNVAMAKERLVAEWAASTNINGARTFLVAESADEERIAQVQRTIKATSARISAIQKDLDAFELSAAEQSLLDEIAARRKTYIAAREAVFELKKTSAEEAAAAVQSQLEPALAAYVSTINRLTNYQSEQIAALRDSMADMAERSFWLLAALGVVSAVLSIAVGLVIARSIRHQLGGEPAYAMEVAERIAAGDLAQAVELRAGDDSSLLHAMNQMRGALATIVGEVRGSTSEIASASSQVADGNLDLSSRTEQQASALEETASSMEELTSTIRQTSDNARQANMLAQSASEIARRGGGVVSEVVSTMEAINQSSQKIADIISVIDGIAFQTNILALNAAVEAARAGEQGRGFAVVASEVRNLAQRSAGAAREIKDLITDSVARVDTGGRLVQQAGATMEEIVAAIARVADMMGEITSASTEQTLGVEQVNSAIGHMDEATQQNAALVEEAAAAAASMREQADRLEQLVGRFTIAAPERREGRASSPARRHLYLATT